MTMATVKQQLCEISVAAYNFVAPKHGKEEVLV